jgi:hypothetical protein
MLALVLGAYIPEPKGIVGPKGQTIKIVFNFEVYKFISVSLTLGLAEGQPEKEQKDKT